MKREFSLLQIDNPNCVVHINNEKVQTKVSFKRNTGNPITTTLKKISNDSFHVLSVLCRFVILWFSFRGTITVLGTVTKKHMSVVLCTFNS